MLPGRHHVNAMSVNDAGNFNDPASFLLVTTEASRQCVAVSNLQELLSFLYFNLFALMTSHEAKHGKTWQNPRLESACSMHCHCFSPFLPWQSAQTYQLQSWRTVPAKSGSSARPEEWWPASHPKATGLGFSASAPSPALSFFLAAWRQRTFGTFGTCSKFRG